MAIDYEYAQSEVKALSEIFSDEREPAIDDKRAVFWRTAFSPLRATQNLERKVAAPHVLVVSALEGIRGSITSQIAVQLSNTALEQTAIEVCEQATTESHEHPLATEIVRRSLKRANEEVYRYAHKMQAGGKIAARGFLAAYDGARVTAACVGPFESFLLRGGTLSSLFDIRQSPNEKAGVLERFIGANSQLLVDLATVKVAKGDLFILTTFSPSEALREMVAETLEQNLSIADSAKRIGEMGTRLSLTRGDGTNSSLEKNTFVAIVRVEDLAISLTEIVSPS